MTFQNKNTVKGKELGRNDKFHDTYKIAALHNYVYKKCCCQVDNYFDINIDNITIGIL